MISSCKIFFYLLLKIGQYLKVVPLINPLTLSSLPSLVVCSYLPFSFLVKRVSSTATTASSILECTEKSIFNFTQNFWLMCCPIFILVTNPEESHNTVTLKQSSEATYTERQIQSCLMWESSWSITFHWLPIPTSFCSIVCPVLLFNSYISYFIYLLLEIWWQSVPLKCLAFFLSRTVNKTREYINTVIQYNIYHTATYITTDRVWINDRIYWSLTTCNYN